MADSRICVTCNQEYFKPKNINKKRWEKRQFCSRTCSSKHYSLSTKIAVCKKCNIEFDSTGIDRNYCSKQCRKDQYPERQKTNSPKYKGGRYITSNGYAMVRLYPDNPLYGHLPYSNKNYVLEHRLVMSQMLGRPMVKGETVHHKNGDKTDNRPENLELRTGNHGRGATIHCLTCTCQENK